MNKKKWREKMADHDSRRWLKSHAPHYSAMKLEGAVTPGTEELLRRYPALKREREKTLEAEAARSGARHGRGPERALERAEGRPGSRELEAVERATRRALRLHQGHKAVKAARLIYWEGKTVKEAADAVGLTVGRTRRLCQAFLSMAEAERRRG